MTIFTSVDPDRDGAQATLKSLDKWLLELKTSLLEKNSILSDEIKMLKNEKDEDKKTIREFKKKLESYNPPKPHDWSNLFQNSKPSQETQIIMAKIGKENREKSKIENNIIISGIGFESTEKDDTTVENILKTLELSTEVTKKIVRINRKKFTDKDGTEKENDKQPLKMILVEFNSGENRQKALLNSNKLKNSDYRYVYINRDKTENEREVERRLRAERNSLNEKLSHEIPDTQGRHRYGIKLSGPNKDKKYYHIIRNGSIQERIIGEQQ